ncbi:hypothetical protein DFH06DRAFT_1184334 [Mycena polygramma]|nr:hypothetical protein DFH06DRAFT_1187729 [Mycena polygramma]KAJ7666626.1 hypothetical protein DFH06DRAFT_1184334 [Mycena polygramma]
MHVKTFCIKLFNVNLSCDVRNVPDDVWLEIMLNSSPLELLAFKAVSNKFRRILAQNPRCWSQARNNIDPPVPPPPQVNSAGVWSESAYAQFIFGGGECVVKSCKRWTSRFPCSFALRIRVCSAKCDAVLHRHFDKTARKMNNSYLTSCAIPGRRGLREMGQTPRLHFRDWLVYDERDMTKYPMYRVCAVATADQEWFSARAITEKRSARPSVAVIRTVVELQEEYRLRAEALPRIMQVCSNSPHGEPTVNLSLLSRTPRLSKRGPRSSRKLESLSIRSTSLSSKRSLVRENRCPTASY